MTDEIRIGLVGAGARGIGLISQLHTIREQEYFLTRKTEFGSHPAEEYDRYASDGDEWIEDVSELRAAVTAVFDPNERGRKRAISACAEHGDDPIAFDTFDEFIESESYDAVIVASPNDEHLDQALPLLDRDIDVLCEKPVATTLEGHDRLIDAAGDSAGKCIVGFNLRSSPLYREIERLLSDGAIGSLGTMTAHNVRTPFRNGFRYDSTRSGGSLLEKNCHDFDLFNWFADADPIRVGAVSGQHVFDQNTDIADHANVIVEYENDVKATLELCLYAPFTHSGHRRYFLRGASGMIETGGGSTDLTVHTVDDTKEISVGQRSDGYRGHGGADVHEMKRFLECLRYDIPPIATVQDAKKAAAIAIGADRSAETGEFVEISATYDLVE